MYADLASLDGLRWYVSAEIFRPLAFAFGPGEVWPETVRYLGWLWNEFMGVGVILGVVGLARAWRRHRPFFFLTAGSFVLQAWFFINYGASDKDQMFLATYLIWALWIGLGIRELIELVDAGHLRSLAGPAARGFALALPVALLASSFSALDFSDDYTLRTEAEQLFAAAPADALVIGTWSEIVPLEYFQKIEHRRPDLTLVSRWPLTDEQLTRLVQENLGERAVYLLSDDPKLAADFRLEEVEQWYVVEQPDSRRRD